MLLESREFPPHTLLPLFEVWFAFMYDITTKLDIIPCDLVSMSPGIVRGIKLDLFSSTDLLFLEVICAAKHKEHNTRAI